MDCGRVVDGKHVRANVDRQHQLGASENHGLDLLLGQLGDQRPRACAGCRGRCDPAASSSKMIRSTSRIHASSIGTRVIPGFSKRLRACGSSIVKRVPSKATRLRPSATNCSPSHRRCEDWNSDVRGNGVVAFVNRIAGDDDGLGPLACRCFDASMRIFAMPSQSPARFHCRDAGRSRRFRWPAPRSAARQGAAKCRD